MSTSTDVSMQHDAAQQYGGEFSGGTTVQRRKIGRPIAYTGDPNAPHLTESERRRIKRWSTFAVPLLDLDCVKQDES